MWALTQQGRWRCEAAVTSSASPLGVEWAIRRQAPTMEKDRKTFGAPAQEDAPSTQPREEAGAGTAQGVCAGKTPREIEGGRQNGNPSCFWDPGFCVVFLSSHCSELFSL